MIVTAALCWWDEKAEDLIDCIRAMANVADRVVALDGAYRRFPGATISSPPEQAEMIRETAWAVGLDCLVLAPDRLWAGQLEKRTYLYQMAAINSDWVVVVDADHIISADREGVRAELEAFGPEVEVIAAPYFVPLDPNRDLDRIAASPWHRDVAGHADEHRLFFRAFPGLRCEGRHWWVSGIKNGDRVWVLHTDDGAKGLPGHTFKSHYAVEHRYLFRSEFRIEECRAFLADRVRVVELTDQEDDVPGLPPPAYA